MADAELRVICGPTAAGKSALAMALAERHPVAIVSADSRQIYRGFDIGTAKPTAEERARVPHRGIDVVEPTARYSAAQWADAAAAWIAEARAAGRTPVVVGGTGFYVRALVAPLFEEPPLDPAARARLQAALAPLPVPELRRWCAALDPARAHLGRAQLLRAVEVALLTGRRLSDLHRETARPPRFSARYLVVDPGAPLAGRIEQRVDQMLAAGWADETSSLMRHVPSDAPAWNATGYRAIRAMIAGTLTPDAARRAVIVDTRQYAKRQRTWFRHQLPSARVTFVNPDDPRRDALVASWWEGRETA